MPDHLEFEQWVPVPLERVFAFFSNPENLPRIMPKAMATRLIALHRTLPPPPPTPVNHPAAGVGSVIETTFRIMPFLPFRAQWTARITEFEWNHYFADVQQKGPMKSWHHRHEFAAEIRERVSGTLVRDVVDYDVGFGWLGEVASRFFVRRQMRNTFAERQQKLPDLLSSSD